MSKTNLQAGNKVRVNAPRDVEDSATRGLHTLECLNLVGTLTKEELDALDAIYTVISKTLTKCETHLAGYRLAGPEKPHNPWK